MNKSLIALILFFFIILSFLGFHIVEAQTAANQLPSSGLVPSCGFNCGLSDLFGLAEVFVKLLIWLATFGVALALIYSGARLSLNIFFPGEYEAERKKAKSTIKTALIGLVIVLSAWVVVDFIFKALGYEGSVFSLVALLEHGKEYLVHIT